MSKEFGLPNDRKECCKYKNLDVAAPDGTLPSKLICLVCRTCGHSEPFLFPDLSSMNAYYAFAEWVEIGRAAIAFYEPEQPATFEIPSQSIQPTFVQVDQEILRSVVAALRAGLEYASSDRDQHDLVLGRKTRKNKITGQIIDREIEEFESLIKKVRALLGWKEIEQ